MPLSFTQHPFRPIDQDRFGAEEGNCLAASIATITGLDLGTLTELLGDKGPTWYETFLDVMDDFGYEVTYIRAPVASPPRGFSIASGHTPRGLLHATVAYNGYVIHDPHPSRAGLTEVVDYLVLTPKPLAAAA